MAVSTTAVRSPLYTPNGATTEFPLEFHAMTAEEVRVYSVLADVETEIVTGYSITGLPGLGTLVFDEAPDAAIGQLQAESNPSFISDTVASNQISYNGNAHQLAFDKLTVQGQFLNDKADRIVETAAEDAAGLVGEAVLEDIADATAAGVQTLAETTTTKLGELTVATGEGVETIEDAASLAAASLGLPVGGLLRIVSPLAGRDEGWAYADMNGWTIPDYHFAPTGQVGQVVLNLHPSIDLSGEVGAYRIADPAFSYDINIILIFHQSGSEDGDAVPILDVTGQDGALMWGTNRPRFATAPFASTFTNAVSTEHIDDEVHWGGDKAMALGKSILQGITDHTGLTIDDHGRNVVVIYAGQSSTWITSIGTGSATRLLVKAHLQEIADYCVANTLSAAIVAHCHHGGEQAYVDGLTTPQVISDLTDFYGPGGDIATDLYPIFEQTTLAPTYCITSHAHDPRGYDIDPRVAEAEVQLAEAESWFKVIKGSGEWFYAGRRRGFAGSGVHPGQYEQALFGKAYADAIVTEQVKSETLFQPIPTFTRTSATEIRASFSNWPAGGFGTVIGSGLYPQSMQANYGWFFCEPATPTVELALTRAPYWDDDEIVFKFSATLPTLVDVRHGARTAVSSLGGNMGVDTGQTYTLDGVTYEIIATIPALNRSVP